MTRGFPSPSLNGFGFVDVASDLSIVAGWQIDYRACHSPLRDTLWFVWITEIGPRLRDKKTNERQ